MDGACCARGGGPIRGARRLRRACGARPMPWGYPRIGDSDDLDHGPGRDSAAGWSWARRRSEGRSRSLHSRRGLRGGVACTERSALGFGWAGPSGGAGPGPARRAGSPISSAVSAGSESTVCLRRIRVYLRRIRVYLRRIRVYLRSRIRVCRRRNRDGGGCGTVAVVPDGSAKQTIKTSVQLVIARDGRARSEAARRPQAARHGGGELGGEGGRGKEGFEIGRRLLPHS